MEKNRLEAFSDGIKYEYKDGKNILTIEKNV